MKNAARMGSYMRVRNSNDAHRWRLAGELKKLGLGDGKRTSIPCVKQIPRRGTKLPEDSRRVKP